MKTIIILLALLMSTIFFLAFPENSSASTTGFEIVERNGEKGFVAHIGKNYYYSHIAANFCAHGIHDVLRLAIANNKTLDDKDHKNLKDGEDVFVPARLLREEYARFIVMEERIKERIKILEKENFELKEKNSQLDVSLKSSIKNKKNAYFTVMFLSVIVIILIFLVIATFRDLRNLRKEMEKQREAKQPIADGTTTDGL